MTTLVVDASIAVKWVIEEDGTEEALSIRRRAKLIAPELLVAECANIFWKKVQRDELSADEAFFAARLLQAADIEFLPTRLLLEAATRIAVDEVANYLETHAEIDQVTFACFGTEVTAAYRASLAE